MEKWTPTVTAKVLGIGVLALLMTIPLLQVSGLVSERQQLREAAIAQIAQDWGGQQVLGGPVLVVRTLRQLPLVENQPTQWHAGSERMLGHVLALMMYLTRRLDLYAYVPTAAGPIIASPTVPPPPSAAIMERS